MPIKPGFRTIGSYDFDTSDTAARQCAQLEQNVDDAMTRIGQQARAAFNVTNKKTADFTANEEDLVLVDSSTGDVKITLPNPNRANAGSPVAIVRLSAANNVFVQTPSGLVNGVALYGMAATAFLKQEFICIGSGWVG